MNILSEKTIIQSSYDKQIDEWSAMVEAADSIDPELYTRYEVKRGLRDISGKGFLPV